mmetsp:Transcript_3177/g.9685  ORF Transcript_3177/g.9685 Transcript_3177/m.9685 type:complete len:389 (-) Transcript_3177:203-1369(-)
MAEETGASVVEHAVVGKVAEKNTGGGGEGGVRGGGGDGGGSAALSARRQKKRAAASGFSERTLWLLGVVIGLTVVSSLLPISDLLDTSSLLRQRSRAFRHGSIPTIIWQSFLADNGRDPFALRKVRDATVAWKSQNPEWQYRVLDADGARHLVERDLGPEHLELYDQLTVAEREIFLKLSTLKVYGGVFTDMDVRPKKPIAAWIPPKCDFVCGYGDDNVVSMTLMATVPEHWVIKRLFNDIVGRAQQRHSNETWDGELVTMEDVTAALSAALTGSDHRRGSNLWELRPQISTSDPSLCMLQSKKALHGLFVERFNVGDLLKPEPTPVDANVVADLGVEADGEDTTADDESAEQEGGPTEDEDEDVDEDESGRPPTADELLARLKKPIE